MHRTSKRSSKIHRVKFSSPTRVNSTSSLKFTLFNVRSLKLKSLLIREKIEEEGIDCFMLTETWLTQGSDACITECCPSGFSLLHTDRKGKSGGGVGIVTRDSLGYTIIDMPHGDSFESVVIRSSNATLPLLTVVYRPPSTNTNKFFTEFSDMLSQMLLYKRPILITGDFNFHVDDSSDKSAMSFIDICSAFGLLQHVREPTHCCGHSLDLVLSNEVNVSDLNVSPLTPSDHYYVSFHTQGMALPTIPTNVAWRRNIRSVSRCDIFPSLAEAGLVHSNACTSNQPDEIVAFLNTGLQKAVDAVAPLRPQRLKACNYPFLLSKKLDKMRRRKRKLERRFKKSGSAIDFKNFKAFLSEYVSELRKNKSSFFHKKLSSSCDDPKKPSRQLTSYLIEGKLSQLLVPPTLASFSPRTL